MRFLLRRAGFYLVALWASVTLAFLIPRWMPGDPAAAMFARFKRKLDPESMTALQEAFGFTDAPLWQQYFTYLQHVCTGDLGVSVVYYPAPVSGVISTALMWTVFLAGMAVLISFVVGTWLGVLAAWRRGGWVDQIVLPSLVFLGAFPYFWLAMLCLFGFGIVLGWLPVRHAYAAELMPASPSSSPGASPPTRSCRPAASSSPPWAAGC